MFCAEYGATSPTKSAVNISKTTGTSLHVLCYASTHCTYHVCTKFVVLLPLLTCGAAAAIGYQGCQHGRACMRCLALAALQAELGLTAVYPITLQQEPGIGQLGQLADDQLFAVAVCVLVVSRYVAAKRANPGARPHYVHGLAPPGCGKTTVLNVAA